MKHYIKHIAIVALFAAGTVFAAATWQTTAGIEDGQVISAAQLRENLDYLYERTSRFPNCEIGEFLLVGEDGAWVCESYEAAEPESKWLVNNQHTEEQCTSLGGVVTISGTAKFCRLTQSTCPAGWAQYQNWSATTNQSCNSYNGAPRCSSACSTGGHAWGNTAIESCRYRTGYKKDSQDGGDCEYTGSPTCRSTVNEMGCY